MANWTVSASTPSETEQAQLWAREAFMEAKTASAWSAYMGEGPGHIIQVDNRFTQEKGDAVNVNLVAHLSEGGVGGDNTLEGNEEAPSTYADSVLLGQLRHAIRLNGRLSEQRSSVQQREHAKDELAYWLGRKMDEWIFNKLSGTTFADNSSNTIGEAATSNTNVMYANDKTAVSGLTESDKFTVDLIEKARTAAESGELGSSTIYKLRPYVVGGQSYYVLWISPYQRYDLRQDPNWRDAVMQARERSEENPIFSGAIGIWDGVIIKYHDLIVSATNGGTGNVRYSTALLCGLQAGYWCNAQEAPNWVEKTFDYANQWGVATGLVAGFDKITYNSIDFGCIAIQTAAKNPIP